MMTGQILGYLYVFNYYHYMSALYCIAYLRGAIFPITQGYFLKNTLANIPSPTTINLPSQVNHVFRPHVNITSITRSQYICRCIGLACPVHNNFKKIDIHYMNTY